LFVVLSRFIAFPLNSFASGIYILTSVIACIGIAQAFFTKTTTYVVQTPLQYNELKGKRIALIADTHFGAVNQQLFARKVVKEVLATKPDAVLIAGDMFDGPRFDTSGVEKEMSELSKKVPVIFTPGNHEEYGPFNDFLDSARRMGMTVLVDQKSTLFGAPVFGLNYRSRKDPQEVETLLSSQLSSTTPSIVLNHEPSFHSELTNAGVFLVVSGHTHGGQFWPGILFARRVYKEYVYGLVQKGMFQSVTTNGIGTFGPRFRTFNTGEVVVLEFK
jgi:predicted MPP superfamily phosphohydrolase